MENAGEKTFTQEEVNNIISKRLTEEKQKYEADIAKRELELKQKEFQFEAKAILKSKDLPDTMLALLKGDDIETFTKNADALATYIRNRPITYREGNNSEQHTSFNEKQYGTSPVSKIRQAMGLK